MYPSLLIQSHDNITKPYPKKPIQLITSLPESQVTISYPWALVQTSLRGSQQLYISAWSFWWYDHNKFTLVPFEIWIILGESQQFPFSILSHLYSSLWGEWEDHNNLTFVPEPIETVPWNDHKNFIFVT